MHLSSPSLRSLVLIESDWNLKYISLLLPVPRKAVLIESDWNLKHYPAGGWRQPPSSINRIRLEFKEHGPSKSCDQAGTVLIESDWNLKHDGSAGVQDAIEY